jgi:protein gp37
MSKIEWCDETWNPVVGCSRISAGCKNCYAATSAASGRLQQFPQYQKVKEWDGTIQLVPSQFDKPFKWKSTKRIFTCSMGDLFHDNTPIEYIHVVMACIALNHQHTFMILTKRPENMLQYFNHHWSDLRAAWEQAAIDSLWGIIGKDYGGISFGGLINLNSYFHALAFPLPNLMLGTSIENQQAVDDRAEVLNTLDEDGWKTFYSVEPLLEKVDLQLIDYPVDWVIVGGESGSNARRCNIEWIGSIVDECDIIKIPCFVKQLGSNACSYGKGDLSYEYTPPGWDKVKDRKFGDIKNFPLGLQVREFPV